MMEMWCYRLPFDPTLETQTPLECGALEGESPVEVTRRVWQYLEYCFPETKQEYGTHQVPTLNTF